MKKKFYFLYFALFFIFFFCLSHNKVLAAGGYLQQINTPSAPTFKAYNGGTLKCSTNTGYLLGANNWVFQHCNADSQADTFLIQKTGINATGYSYVSFNLLLNGVYILDNGNAPMPSITFNKTPCQITAFTSNTSAPNTNDGYMSVSAVCPIYANVFDAEISISSIYKYIVNNSYQYAVSNFMFYTDINDFTSNLNTIVSQLQQLHTDNSNINDTIIIKTNEIIAWLSSLHTDNGNINQTIIDKVNELKAQNNNIKSSIDSVNNSVQETNDTIKSENTSGAESSADALVNNSAFDDSTGLSAIIGLPLTFINNLGNSCQPITLTIPYMDYTFQLPCIQSIVNNFMPGLVVVIKVIVNGLIIYWVLLDIFKIVKSAKNPEDDRIEVLDL